MTAENLKYSALTPWGQPNFDAGYLNQWHPENGDAQLSKERTTQEVDFVERSLRLVAGNSRRILDVACGHLRHVNGLTARGHRVVGLDFSDTFLKRGLKDAARIGLNPSIVKGSMLYLPFDEQFDYVLSLFTSFGYFKNPDDNQNTLREFHRVLRPDGQLLIDVADLDPKLRRYAQLGVSGADGKSRIHETQMMSGIKRQATHTYDPKTQVEHTHREWVEEGKNRTYDSRITYYTRPQLEIMLETTGFKIEASAGDYNWNSPGAKTDRVILLARKVASLT